MDRKRVLIIGAAGRDFHNFNTRAESMKQAPSRLASEG